MQCRTTMQGETKDTKTYTATEARNKFSDLFDAAHFGERVVVRKRNRRVAIVSMSFLEHVDRLLEMEAALEAKAAKVALDEFQEKGGKSMIEIEKELGLD